MGCGSSRDEAVLAKEILGNKPEAQKNARRLSATGVLGNSTADVWVLKPTQDIKDYFKFGKQINKGKFGVLYEVLRKEKGERYACKVISKRKLQGADALKDIRREVQILHHLRG